MKLIIERQSRTPWAIDPTHIIHTVDVLGRRRELLERHITLYTERHEVVWDWMPRDARHG